MALTLDEITVPVLDIYGDADTTAVNTAAARLNAYNTGVGTSYTQIAVECTLGFPDCVDHQFNGHRGPSNPVLENTVANWMAIHAPLGATVFAIEFGPTNALLGFDTASPGTQTVINAAFSPSNTVFGLDFSSSAKTLFGITNATRELGTINTTTGVFSTLTAVTGILSNHNITGLSVDPTTDTFFIYSVHGFGGTNPGALYTLDPTTGVATLVGIQVDYRLTKVVVEFQFEAVLGKTQRTEF